MGAVISQQPNGLYCRFSTVLDCPTHYNMTREDYLNNVTGTISNREEGEDILTFHLQPFSEVIDRFAPNNMSEKKFDILVKIMSGDITIDENYEEEGDTMEVYVNQILKGQKVILSLEGVQTLLEYVDDSTQLTEEDKKKFETLKCERDSEHSRHGLGAFDSFQVYI